MYEVSEYLYDEIDTDIQEWNELNARVQLDLLAWLNIQDESAEDRQRFDRWRPQTADEKYTAIVHAMRAAVKFTDERSESFVHRELGPKQVAAT